MEKLCGMSTQASAGTNNKTTINPRNVWMLQRVSMDQISNMDLVDPNAKVYYVEAQQSAPEIVESESPFDLFLRAENMNEQLASSKLAMYWKYRKELFGPRALQRLLDLSGDGALDHDDISVLRMGCVVTLPDDDKGRKVICFDDLRCHCSSESIRMHCWFYMLVAASVQRKTNPDQELVVILIRDSNRQFDYEKFFIMINDAIPIKVTNIHCCYLQSEQDLSTNYVSYLATFLRQIFKNADESFVSIHAKIENQDMYLQLQEHGLHKENLPTTLGGSWLYLSFQADIDQETNSYKSKEASAICSVEKTISDERRIKKRKTDVAYARKRRRMDKLLEMNLKQQCLTLAQKNDKLRQEYTNLLQAMVAVKNIVNVIEIGKVADLSSASSRPLAINRGEPLPFSASTLPSFNLSRNNIASPELTLEQLSSNMRAMLAENRQSNDGSHLLAEQNQQLQHSYSNGILQQMYIQNYLSNLSTPKFTMTANSGNQSGLSWTQNQIVAALNQQWSDQKNQQQQQQSTDDAIRLQLQLRLMGRDTGTSNMLAAIGSSRSLQNQTVLQPTIISTLSDTTSMESQILPSSVPNAQVQQLQNLRGINWQQRFHREVENEGTTGSNISSNEGGTGR